MSETMSLEEILRRYALLKRMGDDLTEFLGRCRCSKDTNPYHDLPCWKTEEWASAKTVYVRDQATWLDFPQSPEWFCPECQTRTAVWGLRKIVNRKRGCYLGLLLKRSGVE